MASNEKQFHHKTSGIVAAKNKSFNVRPQMSIPSYNLSSEISPIKEAILKDEIKVVSFDIFDTVLTRTVAQPRGIFDLCARRINECDSVLPERLRNDFSAQRIRAEKKARSNSVREDIKLDEIYEMLSYEFELTSITAEKLAALEISIELECSIGVPGSVGLVRFARALGKRIIYISDMYLPKTTIIELLKKAGAHERNDNIYISGECGLAKTSGKLFDYVLNVEKCLPSEIVHIGDHYLSDFKIPKRFGIKSFCFNEAHLNRYEKAILSDQHQIHPAHQRQIVAGLSRKVRLAEENDFDKVQRTIYQFGTNVAGPILFFFTLWALQETVAKNIKRLFVIDENDIFTYGVVKQILCKTGYNLELRYLHGSGQDWSLASITRIGTEEVTRITRTSPLLTIRMVSTRLGLQPELLISNLSRVHFNISDLDTCLSSQDILKLSLFLLNDQTIQRIILEKAASARNALLAYMDQEKLSDGLSFALLDTGASADTQIFLKKISDTTACKLNMAGFYFGINFRYDEIIKESYLFDTSSPSVYQAWGNTFISLFKAFRQIAADKLYDECSPAKLLHKEKDLTFATKYVSNIMKKGISSFIDEVPTSIYKMNPLEYRENLFEIIKLFISTPDVEEVDALGRFYFAGDQPLQEMTFLAPPLSIKTILASLFEKTDAKRRMLTFWPEASLLRSGRLIRAIIPLKAVRPFMKLIGSIPSMFF
jgi:FMN phosphatase YigB (HAD superfamily)